MPLDLFKQNASNHMIECATDIFPYLTIGRFYKIENIIVSSDKDMLIHIRDDEGYKLSIPYQNDIVKNKLFNLVKINNKNV